MMVMVKVVVMMLVMMKVVVIMIMMVMKVVVMVVMTVAEDRHIGPGEVWKQVKGCEGRTSC